MNIQLGIELINSYKRLSYKAWYALAEFVDNSTQAYSDYKKILEPLFKKTGEIITVSIQVGSDKDGEFIRITDNSIGMTKDVLENAIVIGKPPVDTSGRSKYGLGMKTAACWLGDYWTVRTKRLGESVEHFIVVDVPVVAKGNTDLQYHEEQNKNPDDHYTIIEIRKLHRNLRAPRTSAKIKNYLRSMYRIDIGEGLNLVWQGDTLDWDKNVMIESRLIKRIDGTLEKENL